MNFDFDWNCVSAGAPYVTISDLGLAFNTPAISLLNNPEDVIIGFDEDQMAIGIKDAKDTTNAKSYKFYGRIRSGWVRIGCKDFVKYLTAISGIEFSPAKKFIAKYDKEEKILYVIVDKNNVSGNDKPE